MLLNGSRGIGPSSGSTDRNRTADFTFANNFDRQAYCAVSMLVPIQIFGGQRRSLDKSSNRSKALSQNLKCML